MPLLRWLASVLRSSIWLVVNLAVAALAFGASAALLTRTDEDLRVPGMVLRTVGAVWLYAALWSWLVRGVLMRPPPARTRQGKPTGAEAARGAAGCLASLVGVALAWLIVGGLADAAWAGYKGDDPSHPARRLADRGTTLLNTVAAQPEAYLPWLLGGVVALLVLNAVLSRVASQPRAGDRPADSKKKASRQERGRTPPSGSAPAQIPTRAGAAIEKAHGGAHGSSRHGTREEAVLGTLRYNPADGGWWARQGGEEFPIRIEAGQDGPSTAQLDLARAVVQRSFEAQLRASDAARTAAQARGVGLPRFTIVAASVGADHGAGTAVTLQLRCEGDDRHQYTVRSTNALHSFALD